ncbi:DedA family protein [Methylobrevis albus]|uniref:DedA family protein n=1 Tax=Methylobrevis albus TaxID=2793297 RepID=A0A931I0N0_9HYPH|nr:DedA family protein [Methylobrevis albus]MBH0236788.1 DedA family protein [Methylobrevis albus]
MFEWVVGIVESMGYLGIFLLMFIENVFPPIPSEVIMPLAGFAAARGELELWLVILSGTLGSIAGAWFWYFIGLWFGRKRCEWIIDRYGRWLTLSREDFDKAYDWFHWRAGWAVGLGRMLPTIRTLISVPAGVARMPQLAFLAWTSLGTIGWTALLAYAGVILESHYDAVESYIDPLSKGVIAVVVIVYVYRLVTFKPSPRRP